MDSRTSDTQPLANLSGAPMPTQKTLHRRQCVPFQLTRFAALNLRILRMAMKGH